MGRFTSAIALADQVSQQVQTAWEKDIELTSENAVQWRSLFTAKTLATRVSLNLSSRIFEVLGSRATASHYGFDRYWRDLRTFTLHDPVDYKLRDIGNWVLNGQLPTITQYSKEDSAMSLAFIEQELIGSEFRVEWPSLSTPSEMNCSSGEWDCSSHSQGLLASIGLATLDLEYLYP